jgi:C-terminal processing protease CtpA/Prc
MNWRLTKFGIKLILLLILIGGLVAGGYWYKQNYWDKNNDPQEEVVYSEIAQVAFIEEAYQLIADNYWQAMSEEQLSDIFMQSLSRIYGSQPELKEKNKAGLAQRIESLVANGPETDHSQMLAQVVDIVLQNLQPFGRSRLYTQQDETALKNTVSNVDPEADLLANLGVDESSTDQEVEEAFEQKIQQIDQTTATLAQKEELIAQTERAYKAVGEQVNRERYAETKVEPTMYGDSLSDSIYYVKIGKFSPTTVEDLVNILASMPKNNQGQALVLDLRSNVGGAIDGLPYFLGPFIGKGQYAYQFFSQGETEDFKTVTDRVEQINSFKQIVVLIDGGAQSSAEVMAAVLKKYHVGVLVGFTTKGWGTVERVFPLENQLSEDMTHSIFLVHSLTLNEVGEPIEGEGVTPDIDVTVKGWQQELLGYFNNQELVNEVEILLSQK